MSDKSRIEWTDATWNIITGCTLVDEGCKHCYAAHLIASWPAIGNHPSRKGLARKNAAGEAKFTGEVRFNEGWLDQPLRWKKPRRIFVCAHGDLFHEAVPDEWLDRVFAVMALCPQHTFQVLTKRPERAREYLLKSADRIDAIEEFADEWFGSNDMPFTPRSWPLANVWLGTSISDQASADLRIPHLLATPAAVRFVSAEPLLGPVDLTLDGLVCLPCRNLGDGLSMDPTTGAYECCSRCDHTGIGDEWGIDWLIVGGESGPHARPMHPDWARSLRDQCNAAGVAFFFKQWGEWAPALHDPDYDGHVLRQTEAVGPFDTWKDNVYDPDQTKGINWRRLGKNASGRQLDGREWNQMPGVSND